MMQPTNKKNSSSVLKLFILQRSSASAHHHITFFTFQLSTLRPGYIRVFWVPPNSGRNTSEISMDIRNCSQYLKLLRIYSKISRRTQSHKHCIRNMKLTERRSFETSEKNYPGMQYYIPEEWNLQTRRCVILNSRNVRYVLFQVAEVTRILWKLEGYSCLYKSPPLADITNHKKSPYPSSWKPS